MFARTITATATALLLAATPALAQSESMSTSVSVADLDLSSAAGRAQLDRRVRRAVDTVCGPSARDLTQRAVYDACASGALADSNRQIAALGAGDTRIQVAARGVR